MKLTDNTRYEIEEVSVSQKFLNIIANKTLVELDQEKLFVFPPTLSSSDDLEDAQLLLRMTNKTLFTTNVMGVMNYRNERLFIGSRFDDDTNFFFYYLLKKVFNVNLINLESEVDRNLRYLDLLVLLFPRYLNEAMKKGLYKEYQVSQYNDMNIKGVIDFKRQMTNEISKPGAVAYNTREFSYENKVIHLIRYTIEFLKRNKIYANVLTQNELTRDNVKGIETHSQLYKQQTVNKVMYQNIIKPVQHSYFIEYKRLQELCIAILQSGTTSFTKKSKEKISGILFDGAWLFEEYVYTLIGNNFDHPSNRTGSGRQHLFDRGRGYIYPDFLSKNHEQMTIADAKYKPIDNIRGRDYLQIVAYMHRFEADKGYFIYPKFKEKGNDRSRLNLLSGVGKNSVKRENTEIIKLGIAIPEHANSFEEFEKEMQKSERYVKEVCGVTM